MTCQRMTSEIDQHAKGCQPSSLMVPTHCLFRGESSTLEEKPGCQGDLSLDPVDRWFGRTTWGPTVISIAPAASAFMRNVSAQPQRIPSGNLT